MEKSSDLEIFVMLILFVLGIVGAWWLIKTFDAPFTYGRLEVFRQYNTVIHGFFSLFPFDIEPESVKRMNLTFQMFQSQEINEDMYKDILSTISFFIVYPVLLVIGAMYFFGIKAGATYDRKFTIDSLIKDQSKVWSFLKPIENLDYDFNIEEGEWAMAMRPISFIAKYRLYENTSTYQKVINPIKLSRQLELQVGRLYNGFDSLQDYEKALLCIFTAHAEKTTLSKKDAFTWLAILDYSYKKPDYSWVKDAWEKYKNSPVLKKAESNHAYVITLLMRMLQEARGVFTTQLFIWLKPKDRNLFYALNAVGRKECFIECAGSFNHFLAECVGEKPLIRPYISNAINGATEAFNEFLLTDQSFYSYLSESDKEKEQVIKEQ